MFPRFDFILGASGKTVGLSNEVLSLSPFVASPSNLLRRTRGPDPAERDEGLGRANGIPFNQENLNVYQRMLAFNVRVSGWIRYE